MHFIRFNNNPNLLMNTKKHFFTHYFKNDPFGVFKKNSKYISNRC